MRGDDGRPLGRPEQNAPLRPVVTLTSDWSAKVARALVELVNHEEAQNLNPPQIDECWVSKDLAIYLRYRIGMDRDIKVGTRITDSNIDPTSAGYALDPEQQALYFLHDIATAPPPEWTDRFGYGWFGYRSPPRDSWEYAVEELGRVATILELRQGGEA